MSDSRASELDAVHPPDLATALDDALRLEVLDALSDVLDPELGINIVDLGLIYGVDVDDAGVHVRLTMTSAACPLGEQLVSDTEDRLRATGRAVDVEVVWEPPWGPERMSDAARAALGWGSLMRVLYLISVWLHILAVITWVGGMIFLVTVVVPWLRRGDRAQAVRLLRETGIRFRTVGWICFAVIAVTGTYNLWARGVRLGDFVRSAWLSTPFGRAVVLKLGLFLVVLAVSAYHDFVVGPRASDEMERAPGSARAERLRRVASLLGRGNAVLALALVAVGVILVRGWPW